MYRTHGVLWLCHLLVRLFLSLQSSARRLCHDHWGVFCRACYLRKTPFYPFRYSFDVFFQKWGERFHSQKKHALSTLAFHEEAFVSHFFWFWHEALCGPEQCSQLLTIMHLFKFQLPLENFKNPELIFN